MYKTSLKYFLPENKEAIKDSRSHDKGIRNKLESSHCPRIRQFKYQKISYHKVLKKFNIHRFIVI